MTKLQLIDLIKGYPDDATIHLLADDVYKVKEVSVDVIRYANKTTDTTFIYLHAEGKHS